jgi:glycosyltransferase involved in cell wall biosynthesis
MIQINHEKFANAIIELLQNKELYQEKSETALQRNKLFLWEKLLSSLLRLINKFQKRYKSLN